MSEEKVPEYLYHYTDVDTLALILKNHTIRFNSLENMDDKQEQMSKDLQNYGRFVFVSCWTEDKVESIPMWRMYTPKGKGIRVKIRTNPFKLYDIKASEFAQELGVRNAQEETLDFKMIIPVKDYLNGEFTLSNYMEKSQLLRIQYFDDEDKLNPRILTEDDNGTSFNLGNLGVYKNTYWDFQKEWRYRLIFYPMIIKRMFNEIQMKNEILRFNESVKKGIATLPFSHYDLKIDDDCFFDMSIMLSPDITESSKIFTNLIIEKYNPSCRIMESELTNLIQ